MGSSGGGGGSGKTDWPDYMKIKHSAWIDAVGVLILAAANPYTGAVPYPGINADLTAIITAIGTFDTYLDTYDAGYITTAITNAATDVFGAVNAQEIPVFEAGMSSINSVQSSSFAIGEAILMARNAASLAREATSLHSQAAIGILDGKHKVAQMTSDYNRIKLIAKNEEEERLLEIEVHEETWPLDLYTYAGNIMASIGSGRGGTSGIAKPSKTQTALGGAMAGAGTGAMIGSMGPHATVGGTVWGAAIGAVIGGVGGYMSGS